MKVCNYLGITAILIILVSPVNLFAKAELSQAEAKEALETLYISFNELSFFDAVYNNDTIIANLFLLAGMNQNIVFTFKNKGMTPLILATYLNHDNMVELLIKKGADVNHMYFIKPNEERTALYYSIEYLNYHICKLLLEKGAYTYVISKNRVYKGKELVEKMLAKREYLSPSTEKPISMDEQAKQTALNILELLKKYSQNDLITLTGKIQGGQGGWTFEPEEKVSETEEYRLGGNLPGNLKKLLEEAKNHHAEVAITGEIDNEGNMYVTKIKMNGKLYNIPHYRSDK